MRDKPGFIIPKMIMADEPDSAGKKKEQDNEKVQRFLQQLDRKPTSQNIETKNRLMEELKGLERLDLLQQMSVEEADKFMYNSYFNLEFNLTNRLMFNCKRRKKCWSK